jgi:hypothetical protein
MTRTGRIKDLVRERRVIGRLNATPPEYHVDLVSAIACGDTVKALVEVDEDLRRGLACANNSNAKRAGTFKDKTLEDGTDGKGVD